MSTSVTLGSCRVQQSVRAVGAREIIDDPAAQPLPLPSEGGGMTISLSLSHLTCLLELINRYVLFLSGGRGMFILEEVWGYPI